MDWVTTSWVSVGKIFATGLVTFVVLLAYARVVGLRSFAKMSTLDFAATVAIGSVLASVTLSNSTPIAAGLAALAVLMLVPWGINALRRRSDRFRSMTDNRPTLLMLDGEILHDNLDKDQVTVADLRAKLREANVLQLSEVRAVVLETTGDVSVLHGDADVDDWLLEGIDRDEEHVVGGN